MIQDDRFDATDSVTICPMTTSVVDAPLTAHPVLGDSANGLTKDCYLMVDKITTVRRTICHTVLGVIDPATLVAFQRSMLVFLGVAG